MMPAGRYYVGDLCYVLNDVWDEVCELSLFECEGGPFTLKDGRQFIMYGTAYGDGCYPSSDGKLYSVDSGTIGCVIMNDSDITPEIQKILDGGLGHLVHFPENFETKNDTIPYGTQKGIIHFGSLIINTVDDENEGEDAWYDNEDALEEDGEKDDY